MNKYYDTVTNTRGDSLPSYRVQVVDSAGAAVSIYADDSGTVFTDEAGDTVNYATANSTTGKVEFYWTAAVGQVLQVLDVSGNLVDATADFANNFVLDGLPGEIAQSAVTDLVDDLAAKAVTADLAATTGAELIGTTYGTLDEAVAGFPVFPELYGAVGDGVTDDTAAIVAALATGRPVIGLGHYLITGNIVLADGDVLELQTVTLTGASARFTNTAAFRKGRLVVREVTNSNGAGHIFVCDHTIHSSHIEFGHVTNNDAAARVFTSGTASPQCLSSEIIIGSHFNTTSTTGVASAIASTVYWSRIGGRWSGNTVRLTGLCYGGSSSPVVQCESTDAVFNHGNRYFIMAAELADAGVLHLGGENASECWVASFDTGTMTGHQVRFYGTAQCHGIKLFYYRTTGTLDTNIYDIYLENIRDVELHCVPYKSTTAPAIYNPNSLGVTIWDGLAWPAVVTGETSRFAARMVDLRDTRPGNSLTLASDTLTLTTDATGEVVTRTVAPESGTSDDLATISGGRKGQVLLLSTGTTGHKITVKHATGNIRLTASTDKVLSNTTQTLMLRSDGTNWYQFPKPETGISRLTADSAAVNASTTLVATGLSVAVDANRNYAFRAVLRYSTGTTPGLKIGTTVPASTTGGFISNRASSGAAETDISSASNVITFGGAAGNRMAFIDGIFTTTAAGNLTLTFAQNTSDASDSKILAGSYLELIG